MNYFFPTNYYYPSDSKIIVVDPETSPFMPKAVINPYITTPITGSLIAVTPNPDFKPIYTTPLAPENNLNYNPEVHENVTNTIYRTVFNKWVYKSSFKSFFKYIKIVNGEAKLSTDKDGNKSNDSMEKKVKFLKEYILSKHRVKKILYKLTSGISTGYKINWYDCVNKYEDMVKDLIHRYMKKKLKHLIEKKINK